MGIGKPTAASPHAAGHQRRRPRHRRPRPEPPAVPGRHLDLAGRSPTAKLPPSLPPASGGRTVLLAEACLEASRASVLGIGVGTPGIIDPDGAVTEAAHLDWRDVPLRRILSERLGLPASVGNDAHVAALAELRATKGSDTLLVVTVGDGIGAGLADGRSTQLTPLVGRDRPRRSSPTAIPAAAGSGAVWKRWRPCPSTAAPTAARRTPPPRPDVAWGRRWRWSSRRSTSTGSQLRSGAVDGYVAPSPTRSRPDTPVTAPPVRLQRVGPGAAGAAAIVARRVGGVLR